jgi:single-strand DNA-binding protein
MVNEAYFSVTGYVATQPKFGFTRTQVPTLSMRVGWTPRRRDPKTGDWADEPSSFATVLCYRKVAENAAASLRRGDPIIVKGTLRTREFEDPAGSRRISVDVLAESIGHDLSRGISMFTRSRTQLAQTAMEQWQAEHGLAVPRPDGDAGSAVAGSAEAGLAGAGPENHAVGDSEQARDTEQQDPDKPDLNRADLDRADRDLSQPVAAELAAPDDELFDEDEAIEILEGAEPVGAPS